VENDYFDAETKKELLSIKDNPKEIEERFYKDLEFGTGGLRGIIVPGPTESIFTPSEKLPRTCGLYKESWIARQGNSNCL